MFPFLVLALLCHSVASCGLDQYPFFASPDSSSLLDDHDFSQLVNETLREWHVPGVAISIVNGKHTHARGFGICTFPDTPVTSMTLFGAGSTSKSHTTAALSLLIDDDEQYPGLDWDTPISHVIKEDFVLMEDDWATNHITFNDALSHRSGFPRHDHSYGSPNVTQKDVTRSLRYLPLTREPRTTFQYSNMMFAVVAHVIETLTGMWLGDFLRERIWSPLGMEHTFLYNEEAIDFVKSHDAVQLATPYRWIPEGAKREDIDSTTGHFSAEEYQNLNATAGAGAVLTTVSVFSSPESIIDKLTFQQVEDYAKYLRSMLYESGPLSAKTYKEVKTPRSILPAADPRNDPYTGPSLYSLGWVYSNYFSRPVWGHGGSVIGFGAEMKYFPDDDYALVCLANTMITSNTVCNILLGRLMEQRFATNPFDWASAAKEQMKKQEAEYNLTTAQSRLFPEVVRRHPPGPLVPLARHEGLFSHAAYQTVNVSIREEPSGREYLHVTMVGGRTWQLEIELKHVAYEWFLMKAEFPWPREEVEKYPHRNRYQVPWQLGRAVFGISPNGQVERLGLELEPMMVENAARREDGMIFFERVVS